MSGFAITGGKGFHMTFSNGWCISVQFGDGNYCDNYRADWRKPPDPCESNQAEIAVFRPDGSWYAWPDGREIQGYLSADEVGNIIAQLVAGTFK